MTGAGVGRGGSAFFREGGAEQAAREAQRRSWNLHEAAKNVIDKIGEALAEGDDERAATLARTVVGLPYDDHEGTWPGAFVAAATFFDEVIEVVEGWPEGDDSWIAVLTDILPTLDGWARAELEHVIGVLWHDAGLLGVTDEEAARLRGVVDQVEMAGPSYRVSQEEQERFVIEVVRMQEDVLERLHQRWARQLAAERGAGPQG